MAIARRGSTEQRRVFDPIGSERPSRKSTKRRSTSAHGWPPVCSRRCRRYLPAPPALPLPLPPPMRDAHRRIVSGGPDGRARLSPCRPVRYANRNVTRRIVIHDFAAHTLAQASKPASKVASSIDAAFNPNGERRAFNACSDDGFGSRRATMDAAMRARSG
ncbi:hypothetical protein [Burkholderia pseudomallei]|uniref:hypothetical protein n=1 Tax=Burkholderia pseudomallei TaxID=28450 RepID=UPI001605509A|nr:hypothetical protein [Burkholderia pseudomallei]